MRKKYLFFLKNVFDKLVKLILNSSRNSFFIIGKKIKFSDFKKGKKDKYTPELT